MMAPSRDRANMTTNNKAMYKRRASMQAAGMIMKLAPGMTDHMRKLQDKALLHLPD
jgi:hypothetical protein